MKFLYVANARIPTEKAHGIQIMKMCEAFGLEGNELELIIPGRINWIKKDAFEYYGIERNFTIRKFPCIDLIPLDKILGHVALWIESMSFLVSSFFHILFTKADVIYTRDKFFLVLSFFKNNLVFEAHTFPKHYFLYSAFLKKTRNIVVITEQLKNLFAKRGIRPDKILVSPDGVDLSQFDIGQSKEECRKRLHLPLDKKIVLYAGHLYPWKGAQVLADSARHLGSEILTYFVGGTEKDIAEFIDRNKHNKHIVVSGHQPYQDMPLWLKSADALVLPNSSKHDISRSWTSPIKLFEYMASKRPIVASDLPSIREILNENNAFLVEPDNPYVLAKSVKKALEDSDFSVKISNQAFQDVSGYTWRKRVEKIINFLSR